MSFFDIMQMCIRNLYRRKGRTALTVSGVIIGCCAIVIMVSLGIGMKQAQDQMLAQMGNLTRITVTPSPAKDAHKTLLDKKAVKQMGQLPDVTSAIVKNTLDLGELQLTAGEKNRFQNASATIIGIPEKDLEKMGYTLTDGKYPKNRAFEVLAGQHFAYQFTDSRRPEGKNVVDYWDNEDAKPFFKAMGTELSVAEKKQKKTSEPGENQTASSVAEWKEIQKLKIVGQLKENYDAGEETGSGLIMRLSDMEKLQKQIQKISGQKKAKEYSQVVVNVKDIKGVEQVENMVRQMGFQTYSMESIRKPMEKDARQKQMMLGGLGAISLLVAAIGIANTMIMSITERTREIGIMKAVGCFLGDIRKEFLLEAAVIGFLGGSIGILLSYLVSWLMNHISSLAPGGGDMDMMAAGGMDMMGGGSTVMSVIPLWLAGFALLFSVFMGVAAGYYPANKAVKISALEAMKS